MKKRFFPGKKGNVTELMGEIFRILLGVVGFILLLYIFTSIYQAYMGNDRGTSKNFNLVTDKINALKAGESEKYAFYVNRDMVLLGFGKEGRKVVYNCFTSRGAIIVAPNDAACFDKSCLCIYRAKGLIKIECKEINNVDFILFNPDPKYDYDAGANFPGTDMHYLCLRSACFTDWIRFNSVTGVLQFEKKDEGGRIGLYFSKVQ
ncbi:MAG: hypothetical protein NTV63_02695 [Candidatus Woesearchaeota archaeon]|nr:hypothetical protein [Candidatus Woesearchaeota archaeon]